MKLEVKNLGPIKRGEIDLDKRFYVFVGYNNSGKTYMAQLLWTYFSRARYGELGAVVDEKMLVESNGKIDAKWLLDKLMPSYCEQLSEYYQKEVLRLSEDSQLGNLQVNIKGYLLKDSFVASIFGQGSMHQRAVVEKENNDIEFKIQANGRWHSPNGDFLPERSVFHQDDKNTVSREIGHLDDSKMGGNEPSHKWAIEILNTFPYCLKEDYNVFFLPTVRAFFPAFHEYIARATRKMKEDLEARIRDGADNEEIKSLGRASYSAVVSSLLDGIEELKMGNIRPNNPYPDFLDGLKNILGGEIKLQNGTTNGKRFVVTQGEVDLDMYLASSSTNQLAYLYLYFKYFASPKHNNFLFIDEPEENLHPENQVKLINLLVAFSKIGNNRVLITTHSPLMADAVNNHIHLGKLESMGEDIKSLVNDNNLDISNGAALWPDDYGVYFFNGEKIFNYESSDYGVSFKDFTAAERKLSATADTLKDKIYQRTHAGTTKKTSQGE